MGFTLSNAYNVSYAVIFANYAIIFEINSGNSSKSTKFKDLSYSVADTDSDACTVQITCKNIFKDNIKKEFNTKRVLLLVCWRRLVILLLQ